MSSVILYITVAERSIKTGDEEVSTATEQIRTYRAIRSLTGFVVIIHCDGCWFGFLHHGRLVNFELERHLVNLQK